MLELRNITKIFNRGEVTEHKAIDELKLNKVISSLLLVVMVRVNPQC